MAQVHSLLNGESPASAPPDDSIPGAPVSILDTSTQDGNNGAPGEMNITEAGNTNGDEADTTSSQGGGTQMKTSTGPCNNFSTLT